MKFDFLMKMFDWDDQELANIIWGEGGEADDHIVPYPEDIEKKVLSDYGDSDQRTLIREDSESETAEKNTSTSKLFLDGSRSDRNDCISASRTLVDSQLDLSSFAVSETDDSVTDKKSQLDTGPETSRDHHKDKELRDLVGNSWDNIESFDDLDRIFSNDDLDGNTSLGSADELWSSSKNLISGAAKSSSAALGSTHWEFGALESTSANIDINSEYLSNENPAVTSRWRKAYILPYSRGTIGRHVEQEEYSPGNTGIIQEKIGQDITVKTAIDSRIAAESIASPNKSEYKGKWSKTQSKHEQETDKISDFRLMRDVYDTWTSSSASVPQYGRQCAPDMVQNNPASVPGQEQLSQEFRPMPYQHLSTPYDAPYACGNFPNQYPVMRMLKPTKDEHQSILSTSQASPGDVIYLNKHLGTTGRPTKMTPQEKIEKLRRRQQMRAMLAIQKQQQQLSHQATNEDYPIPRRSCLEDQVPHMGKTDFEADEILSTFPCYDPSSPNKGDESSRITNIDDYSVEDTVLYQLQEIISRLDLKIRLCIRDSLYRLAHSATQRHHATNANSTKRSSTSEPDIAKDETSSHDRFVRNADVETETNHIDRAVAHLLFHRPLKLSLRHAETPESSTLTKVPNEQEAAGPTRVPVSLLGKSSEKECNLSPHRSKSPQTFVDPYEEDVSRDVSRKETRSNPQMKQMTTEHTD